MALLQAGGSQPPFQDIDIQKGKQSCHYNVEGKAVGLPEETAGIFPIKSTNAQLGFTSKANIQKKQADIEHGPGKQERSLSETEAIADLENGCIDLKEQRNSKSSNEAENDNVVDLSSQKLKQEKPESRIEPMEDNRDVLGPHVTNANSYIMDIHPLNKKPHKKELNLRQKPESDDELKNSLKLKFPDNPPPTMTNLDFIQNSGCGMCGQTKKFWDRELKRAVVVKRALLKDNIWEKEINNLRILESDHTVKFCGCVALEGGIGIVTEDAGETLFKYWTTSRLCQNYCHPGRVMECHTLGLLKGLEYLWKNERVHCDIKPENVCVNENNDVKIIDFGTCRRTDDPPPTSGFTHEYLSPEWNWLLIRSKESKNCMENKQFSPPPISHLEDTFASGMIILFMERRHHPMQEFKKVPNEINSVMAKFAESGLPSSFFKCSSSAILEELLPKLLHKNPAERWPANKVLDKYTGQLEESCKQQFRHSTWWGEQNKVSVTDVDLARRHDIDMKAKKDNMRRSHAPAMAQDCVSSDYVTVDDLQISTSSS